MRHHVQALSKRTVTLDRLDLKVANCRMAWLINLLTKLFSGAISTYVCRALQQQLDGHASDLLGSINGKVGNVMVGFISAYIVDAIFVALGAFWTQSSSVNTTPHLRKQKNKKAKGTLVSFRPTFLGACCRCMSY